MQYIEIKIYTTQEGIDPLTCILTDMGIAGFAVEDARDFQDLMNRKNTYEWDYIDESLMALEQIPTNITFYLEDTAVSSHMIRQLEDKLAMLKANPFFWEGESDQAIDFGTLEMSRKHVDDSQWKDNWKEYFKPTAITDRIVIKPTWEEYARKNDELIIELDPGMAFGTGTHPTTTLCVRLLERYVEAGKDKVLDVGCGSGILAIAAALLGAVDVLAVDIDPIAVVVTNENANQNHLSDQIRVLEGVLTKGLSEQADIIVANLMADLVIKLSRDVAAHLKGKSIYISSGILLEKQESVAAAIEACGFQILEILEEGEWCAIAAQLK
jgi:ribosomal protein L11 methyltransferase